MDKYLERALNLQITSNAIQSIVRENFGAVEKKKYEVSIIVLTYNKFDNFDNNIKSISMQSFKDYEVIVSDDGSDLFDEERIIKTFEKNKINNYVILRSEKNRGTVKNYNYAIYRSRGKIIVPLPQDDCFFDKKSLEKIVRYMNGEHLSVCTSYGKGDKTGQICPRRNHVNLLKKQDDCLFMAGMLHAIVPGCSLFFIPDVLPGRNRECFFDTSYYLMEDWPFLQELIEHNVRIGVLEEITLLRGENGVSSGGSKKLGKDVMKLFKKKILPAADYFTCPWIKEYINYRCIRYAMQNGIISLRKSRYYLLKHLRIVPLFVFYQISERMPSRFYKARFWKYMADHFNKKTWLDSYIKKEINS